MLINYLAELNGFACDLRPVACLIWHCIKVLQFVNNVGFNVYQTNSKMQTVTAERYEDNYGVLQSVKICAYDIEL